MPEAQSLTVEQKGRPESIKSATFPVKDGDLLKLRATVIDTVNAANERALVCTIRFFDEHKIPIEQAYGGTSVSAVYGSYVYVESKRDGEAIPWIKEVIVAPVGARFLQVEFYPWKTTPNIQIADDIECLDIRRIPTDEISWSLSAGESRTEKYEVLPFWRSLFSFDVLKKLTNAQNDIQIKISFLGPDGNQIEVKTAAYTPVMGMVDSHGIDVLVAIPTAQECEYEGYVRLMALVQLIPPAAATSAVVTIDNQDDTYSVRVSQRIFAFEALIESRFAADAGNLIAKAASLPADLAQLSFAKLKDKRPDDLSVYDAALEFYLASDNLRKITTTANSILNRFHDGSLCAKARNALALVTETMPSWRPGVAQIESRRDVVSKNESSLKVAHFLTDIANGDGGDPTQAGWDLVCAQKMLIGSKPCVILPLGYPEKGTHGLPWERHEHEDVACYYLNCLSVEQLQTIPVTSQLNFSAVLASDILAQEGVELIHVQEGERVYDLTLVGLALARALRIPLVYQKFNHFDSAVYASSSHQTLSQARAMREYQCMTDADAVIVSSEAQRASLASVDIPADKVFVWPTVGGGDVIRDRGKYREEIAELCRRAYTYAGSVNQKKYT
jgi:hypothetical protein